MSRCIYIQKNNKPDILTIWQWEMYDGTNFSALTLTNRNHCQVHKRLILCEVITCNWKWNLNGPQGEIPHTKEMLIDSQLKWHPKLKWIPPAYNSTFKINFLGMRRSPTKSWELGWPEITLYIYNVNRKLSEFTDRQLVPPSALYWDLQPQWINYDNSGEKGAHQQVTLQNIVATIKIQVWSQRYDAKLKQTT